MKNHKPNTEGKDMPGDVATWITVALACMGGLLALIGWLLAYVNSRCAAIIAIVDRAIEQQNTYRHANTDRINIVINELEDRVTRRIERLENGRFSPYTSPQRGRPQ